MHYRQHRAPLLTLFIGALSLSAASGASAFELHGFADISYHDHVPDSANPDDNGSFALGPLDFYVAEALGPRVDVLAEVAFESGIVDLERLQIGYLFSDALKVYAGRFHTSLGYWNTAYHHGAFLHTTIMRPSFLNFEDEGGVLPVHSVGLMLSGRQFLGVGELSYIALVGNGSSVVDENGVDVLTPNSESDPNKNKAVGLRGAIAPSGLTGWTLGASGYSSRVIDDSQPAALDVTQTILGADAVYANGPYELIAEYFLVRDKDELGTATATNHLYYIQFGREFADRVMPYARYEQMSVAESDPYMIVLSAIDKRMETAGVRIRVGDQSALKFEGRFITDDGSDSHQEYGAQWAFAF